MAFSIQCSIRGGMVPFHFIIKPSNFLFDEFQNATFQVINQINNLKDK